MKAQEEGSFSDTLPDSFICFTRKARDSAFGAKFDVLTGLYVVYSRQQLVRISE